ncbi:MAG: BREX system P-loop protein BrxC [Lactobacillus sp.]|uniref:BREX system P-loop protein BrxC n=1 Tax=Bacillus cereus TaxID=1396 RepID=UPI0010BD9BA5|nr:BREX system P-loop protein BrxC [Bacillus cereus]MCT6901727.1 BREX system P-loop protein BrxC [Lactobacillus sp.]MED3581337.1 BREX system P-loop protein BrxC [Bacillus thuringiensis]TKI38065.1 BREX system P-loop protein BrxC [Bacillus cereus]
MQIQKMFEKEIDRDIKGVIKVGQDDDKNIYQELDEYVVTNELLHHMGEFFKSYKKGITGHTDKMGVWISGFFGSGKSHFLKILSYLLENKHVMDGKEINKDAISFFNNKILDPMVLADMKLAGNTTTDVILFNIDSKSESDSKSDKNAIVKVFNKVFNEMQGFCGSIPWIADLERQMVKDGCYEEFKAEFEKISGNTWEEAREDFYYEEDSIIEALSKTTKMSEDAARNWYERAEEDYFISIDRFAKRVREYVETKGNNHHVVFLIDELGQYIGNDSQLMLNLQTVVEDIGTQCGGKVWVLVTSQQDIDSVVKVNGNDFSKIQGRFDTRLSLSSAHVDEVIKKRILLKNEVGKQTLRLLYGDNSSILKNLITFSGDTAEMKIFNNEEDFVDVYPFIPYQFNLLQKVFTGIRIHGASGKHLAEGERSLLSAFQESAMKYAESETGALIPFSAFYQTIEAFLDSSIRTVIIHAQNNSRLNEYDVEVLKLLFLIKYVKELPANLENLATLMIQNISDDKIELKKKIESSLIRLSKETLIQKNGQEYIFLTNDEQDVNREIKNMHVDSAEVIQKIGDVIFNVVYQDKKYRYSPKYHFSFNTIIDDRPIGMQTNDIGLKIITPYFDATTELNDSELKMMSMRESNVILKLPQDTSYLDEMTEILRIQAYLKIKSGTAASQAIEDIKVRKSREANERKDRVHTYVTEALKHAEIFVNSQQLDVKEKNPVERINDAFKVLIDNLYNKLHYVKKFIDTAKQLNELLVENTTQLTLSGDNEDANQLAVKEVNDYIARLTTRNQQITIKGITTHFTKQPYGWKDLDIASFIIKLFKGQEIKLQLNSSNLTTSERDLVNYITKRDYVERVVVKKRERISPALMKVVKDLSKEVFEVTALPDDEDGLMNRFKELLASEKNKINVLLVQYRNTFYPGQDVLQDGKESIEQLLNISDTTSFYNKAKQLQNDFLDYAEDVEPVKAFFETQRDIYDDAVKRLNIFEKNQTYVTDQKVTGFIESISKIVKHKEPYKNIHQLPGLIKEFDELFVELLEKECEPIKNVIESDYQTVLEELNKYEEIKSTFFNQFKNNFDGIKDRLNRVNNFYEAIAMQTESDRLKVRCIDDIANEVERRKPPVTSPPTVPTGTGGATVIDPIVEYKAKTKTISKNTILRGTKTIENTEDIEAVLDEIRKQLQKELEDVSVIKLV